MLQASLQQLRPDGGFLAWTIVASTFFTCAFQDGIMYGGYGVMVPPLVEKFQTGRGPVAGISGVMMFMCLCSAPLSALCIRKVGHRTTFIPLVPC